jgi:hypothetical protein
MAGFTGLDITQVRGLANFIRQKADEIEQIQNQVTQRLHGTQWVGPDRQKFEGDWSGHFTASLRTVAGGLRDAAQIADTNATQQEQASNA